MWAGFIGVIAYFVIGRICTKIGVASFPPSAWKIAGASIFYGNADTIATYFIGLTLVTVFINGAAYIGGGNWLQWFPKKKGLAKGYTTMATTWAAYVPLIAALIGAMGMAKAMTVTGIAAIVIGIGAYFIIRNTPQELSIYPDNVSEV
ncbi:MAG: hypothetical protein ACLTXL_09700 [Clostridia bacterium]